MLLETLDLRTNDVLIYSQNMFNFNNSFKIIYKNEKNKRPKRISYFDVCAYVKDPSPKNLVIYRLLTNVNALDAYSTKYGYFIKINGKAELVYFDPIFAIKDLRHLRFDFDPKKFRFKIQQVGLTSLTKKEAEPSFAEVYSFDLRAIEAQNQNDKIFADAIFAFDPGYNDEDEPPPSEKGMSDEGKMERFFRNTKETPKTKTDHIAEDKGTKGQSLSPLNTPDGTKVHDLREEIIGLLKQAMGIESSSEYLVGSRGPDIEHRDARQESARQAKNAEVESSKYKGRRTKMEESKNEKIERRKDGEEGKANGSQQLAVSGQKSEVKSELASQDMSRSGKSEASSPRKTRVEAGSEKSEVSSPRKTRVEAGSQRSDEKAVNVFDLFKSTNKSNELSDRAKESIVLKFE